MNWKGYLSRQSWPNPGTILVFMEALRKIAFRIASVPP